MQYTSQKTTYVLAIKRRVEHGKKQAVKPSCFSSQFQIGRESTQKKPPAKHARRHKILIKKRSKNMVEEMLKAFVDTTVVRIVTAINEVTKTMIDNLVDGYLEDKISSDELVKLITILEVLKI